MWTLHNKINLQIKENHKNDSGEKLSKFTNQFIKKITYNLNNFSYNVIIANLHEMYSFLLKEMENSYSSNTLIENYKKILITIMPIVPHFSNECFQSLNLDIGNDFKWPQYDETLLVEDTVNIVVQVNGKKRGLIKTKKNISETQLFGIIQKEKNIYKYLNNQKIKKKIFVQDRLINFII